MHTIKKKIRIDSEWYIGGYIQKRYHLSLVFYNANMVELLLMKIRKEGI